MVEKGAINYVRPQIFGDGGGHPKCLQVRTGGGGVTPHLYVRSYTVSFHVFDKSNYIQALK